MAIGRISGSVLKSNLTRNGTDLAFETNLLYLDVTNARIGIGTSEPTTALQVAGTIASTGLTVDTNTLHVDSANNRVGIGTTSPAYQVEIENTGSNALLVLDRTDGAACFIEGQATRSAFGSVGATPLALAYNSAAVVLIGENGAITVNPDGDGFTLPTTDGTAGQVLATDGEGNVSFTDLSIGDLVITGSTISAPSNADLTLSPGGTGKVVIDGLSFPTADGTSGQVLQTNGSGTLSFTTISTNSVSQGDSNVTVTDSGTGSVTVTADGNTELVINDTDATFSGSVVIKSQQSIKLNDTDNSHYIAFRAPSTVTSNTTHTLPNGYGSDGQVLSTDGAGTLSWVDAGAGGGGSGSSYPNSTISTMPGSEGNYDLAEGPAQDGDETPFEAGNTDPFGVNLGTVFDMMDPVGTIETTNLGESEAYVGA